MIRQLSHSRPQVRKAAVLVLGSLWSTSPSAATLPVSQESIVDKLAEKLLDDDPSVVGATVNVMLEMARACKNEEDRVPFLRLAPECFDLLTSSTNNWTLIKLIKLFALLTPVEPRLVRKLLPPLTSLITTTPAMSLLYECIHAVIAGGMLVDNEPLAKTCVTKLATFLQDSDQNRESFFGRREISSLCCSTIYLLTGAEQTPTDSSSPYNIAFSYHPHPYR